MTDLLISTHVFPRLLHSPSGISVGPNKFALTTKHEASSWHAPSSVTTQSARVSSTEKDLGHRKVEAD